MNRRDWLSRIALASFGASTGLVRARDSALRIGLTAVILADQAAFLSRWSAHLAASLQADVAFVARDSYQAILDMLFAGQVDAAWICGYPYVRFQSRLRLLAVPLYRGEPRYQSYLIRAKSGKASIGGWADLRGSVFAYSDPLSNSGWLVAQAELADAGLRIQDLRRAFFAHGHRNVAEAVAARLAHAGSIDGYVWETMRRVGIPAAERTEVIWKSPPHGFPPVVAALGGGHPKLDRLQEALLAMDGDREGGELLAELNLTGFDAGVPSIYDSIRRLAARVPGSGVRG